MSTKYGWDTDEEQSDVVRGLEWSVLSKVVIDDIPENQITTKFRVCFTPQFPIPPFCIPAKDKKDAVKILKFMLNHQFVPCTNLNYDGSIDDNTGDIQVHTPELADEHNPDGWLNIQYNIENCSWASGEVRVDNNGNILSKENLGKCTISSN
jgi:hypothetical protein